MNKQNRAKNRAKNRRKVLILCELIVWFELDLTELSESVRCNKARIAIN